MGRRGKTNQSSIRPTGLSRWLPRRAVLATVDQRHWTPLSRALEAVGDHWTLLILCELAAGPLRAGVLADRLPGISRDNLNLHLRQMITNRLVVRHSMGLSAKIEYALTDSAHELIDVVRGLSLWGMRRRWSAPDRKERVELRLLMGHIPLMVERTLIPSGVVELVVENPESLDRHVVKMHDGEIVMAEAKPESVVPWARIAGNEVAWIGALGPKRSHERLDISGDNELAGALLRAIPTCL